jgi:hypothetical protein
MTGLETLHRKGLVTGLEVDEGSEPSKFCEACVQAKQSVRPFPKEADGQSQMPGEHTMSDVWGPARVASVGGGKYYISFTDDATRRCTTLFLKTKDEAGKNKAVHPGNREEIQPNSEIHSLRQRE